MGYVVLKDAVLLWLRGRILGRAGVTEDWDMMAVVPEIFIHVVAELER